MFSLFKTQLISVKELLRRILGCSIFKKYQPNEFFNGRIVLTKLYFLYN